ncbi:hypothetical protein TWF225_000115 [Orbilia oligospora]|nr:hypothetical protein TWF225_000115 [Orbilia oligospora]KAF3256679.1 hypothetical protein TWF128_005198 [Orbilia oligospora]KAF3261433.1 hypothetical protein TWF217_004574 [Orbilia oligospora]KAF3294265.1 hypothetical protein TWF132_003693 [Orbilia oligospora]
MKGLSSFGGGSWYTVLLTPLAFTNTNIPPPRPPRPQLLYHTTSIQYQIYKTDTRSTSDIDYYNHSISQQTEGFKNPPGWPSSSSGSSGSPAFRDGHRTRNEEREARGHFTALLM